VAGNINPPLLNKKFLTEKNNRLFFNFLMARAVGANTQWENSTKKTLYVNF